MSFLNRGVHSALMFIAVFGAAYLTGTTGKTTPEKQCYWCGPLAEEVQNSRRAAPCHDDKPHEVAKCSRDQPYCAVVVTAPPYTESRVCTRYYQDECYARYCNTSKIWKMTCSCQGDLCNGAITERESEAFSSVTNLVAKTQNVRTKRNSASLMPRIREGGHPMILENRKIFIINQTKILKPILAGDMFDSQKTFNANNSYKLIDDVNMPDSHSTAPSHEPSIICSPHSTHSTQISNILNTSRIMTPPTDDTIMSRTYTTSNNYKLIIAPITVSIENDHRDQVPEEDPANNTYTNDNLTSQLNNLETITLVNLEGHAPKPTNPTKNKAFVSTSLSTIIIILQLITHSYFYI